MRSLPSSHSQIHPPPVFAPKNEHQTAETTLRSHRVAEALAPCHAELGGEILQPPPALLLLGGSGGGPRARATGEEDTEEVER